MKPRKEKFIVGNFKLNLNLKDYKPQEAAAEVVEDHQEDLSVIELCYLHQYLLLLYVAVDKQICQFVQIFQLLVSPL